MADEEEPTSHQRTHHQTHHQTMTSDSVSILLSSWGLSELTSKFKSHEIDNRALLCLTEKDICELIPKIGRRAIFRSSLIDWRRKNLIRNHKRRSSLRITSTRTTSPLNEDITNNITPSQVETVIKLEQVHSDYESEEINDENIQHHNQNGIDMNALNEMDTGEEDESLDGPSSGTPERKKFCVNVPSILSKQNSSGCHVDVSEILSNTPEGRQIIAYYEVHGGFDYSHRRRLVTVIINEVVRQNRWLVQDDFAKISNDIIQLFPREDIATYYTARNGLKNPKGCLYNKFLNLTRKLRQEGILQYRNNVQLMPERVSARHFGAVKSYKNNY